EDHEVAGEYAEVARALARRLRLGAQRRAQPPLVSRDGALRLPALPVDAPVPAAPRLLAEAPDHLPPVARLGPPPPAAAAVERDHRGADAEGFAAVAGGLLAVEGGVRPHPVGAERPRRLGPRPARPPRP